MEHKSQDSTNRMKGAESLWNFSNIKTGAKFMGAEFTLPLYPHKWPCCVLAMSRHSEASAKGKCSGSPDLGLVRRDHFQWAVYGCVLDTP